VTLAIMASGTIIIAFTPAYATIGLVAPIVVVIGRLLQAFRRASNSAAFPSISRKSRNPA